MAVKDNITKWVFGSALKAFTDVISTNLAIHVEGAIRDTNDESDWCELRIDGPAIREISKNLLKITCEVNILVSTHIDPENLYREVENLNVVVPAFTDFDVYKYGSGAADDQSRVGRLRLEPLVDLRERIQISKFGQIDPSTPLMQATVEGHFIMLVVNE